MLKYIVLKALEYFTYALYARIIIDYVRIFARNWRPNSFVLAIFEIIYSITDKPIRFVQRFIPPLRVGGAAIDLSFIVLLIAISITRNAINLLL